MSSCRWCHNVQPALCDVVPQAPFHTVQHALYEAVLRCGLTVTQCYSHLVTVYCKPGVTLRGKHTAMLRGTHSFTLCHTQTIMRCHSITVTLASGTLPHRAMAHCDAVLLALCDVVPLWDSVTQCS